MTWNRHILEVVTWCIVAFLRSGCQMNKCELVFPVHQQMYQCRFLIFGKTLICFNSVRFTQFEKTVFTLKVLNF